MNVPDRDRRALALLEWYRDHRRELPWRANREPWPVLVSEVMLQQTQAGRVVPYFERFIARFPTPVALTEATVGEILALWSGLGYNRRALRLQEAAGRIAAGGWSTDTAGLQALPGIGPYTAAAVACFAFGEQIPAVDTNVRRVVSRWYGRPLSGSSLTETARNELPEGRAADWNQAVMDLGAGLCRPTEPLCGDCPVARWCAGPTTYVAPPPQGRFRGSNRESRGAIIRHLVQRGPATLTRISRETGLDRQRLNTALKTLVEDRMIEETESGSFRLPGS